MEILEFLKEHKDKASNIAIIAVALIVSLKIYDIQNKHIQSLKAKNETELKKNDALKNISRLEIEIQNYKSMLKAKDSSTVMATLSSIAKDTGVQVLSIKPSSEQKYSAYLQEVPYTISVVAPNYHVLGKFISKIESNKNVYIIDDAKVSPETQGDKLTANLKIGSLILAK